MTNEKSNILPSVIQDNDIIRGEYNCHDVLYTLEICNKQIEHLTNEDDVKFLQYLDYKMHQINPAVHEIMLRGIKIDVDLKNKYTLELEEIEQLILKKLSYVIGEPFNPRSSIDLKAVFLDLLEMKPVINKKSGNSSFGSNAIPFYQEQRPEFTALFNLILEYRSVAVFLNTFMRAIVDDDGRIRTTYNVAGTNTDRLSSRKTSFNTGCNLANLPKKGKLDITTAFQEVDNEEDSPINYLGEIEGSYKLPNVKKMFIPDDELSGFFNIDLSSADAQIVAYDAECKFLIDFFNTSDLKLYQYIANHYLQREIDVNEPIYKIFKQYIHGCLTEDHQVLTKKGWVNINKYDWKNDELMVWDKDNILHFELPLDFTVDFISKQEHLYSIEGASLSFLGTQNHTFPTKNSHGTIKKVIATDLISDARIPCNGIFLKGTVNKPDYWIRLLVAFQADGTLGYTCLTGETTVSWHLKKKRKVNRLLKLLKQTRLPYKIVGNANEYYIYCKGLFTAKHKKLNWNILNLSENNLNIFVEELFFWDGYIRKDGSCKRFFTIDPKTAEIVNTIIHLTGRSSKITTGMTGYSKKILYKVSINKRKFFRLSCSKRNYVQHNGTTVYCPTTSTGYFIVKRNNNIYITGNSHYGMQSKKAAILAGIPLKEADKLRKWYFQKCPEIPEWHKYIEKCAKEKRYIQNYFGTRMYFLDFNDPTWLNKAIASIPQSSIAVLINMCLVNLRYNTLGIKVQMQTHDALAGNYPLVNLAQVKNEFMKISKIPLYDGKLFIGIDMEFSEISYGDCK